MLIEIKNYSKYIGKTLVLDNISLNLSDGKVYGFKGKNGSGKTMLMRAICGLIHKSSGEIKIDGEEIGVDISFPKSVGVLIETPGFISNYTGYQNLKLLADINGIITHEDIQRSLERVGLDAMDKRKYRKYSLGMKQRLGIAAAIMESPRIMILDEPTNALDDDGIELLHKILLEEKGKNRIIIISSHDKDELENICDEIITIENGRIKDSNYMNTISVS